MVHSSMLVITADEECLTCCGFSLGETIHFESLEFITNYFGNLSLSLRGDSSAIFGGMTHSGS
jgi:hypothetical protein